jgi:hypothetical protein
VVGPRHYVPQRGDIIWINLNPRQGVNRPDGGLL